MTPSKAKVSVAYGWPPRARLDAIHLLEPFAGSRPSAFANQRLGPARRTLRHVLCHGKHLFPSRREFLCYSRYLPFVRLAVMQIDIRSTDSGNPHWYPRSCQANPRSYNRRVWPVFSATNADRRPWLRGPAVQPAHAPGTRTAPTFLLPCVAYWIRCGLETTWTMTHRAHRRVNRLLDGTGT